MTTWTTDIREIMKELGVSRATAEQISGYRAIENRALAAKWQRDLPALRARCDEAYDTAFARYKAKNPDGKNAAKSALRAAREIWGGYQR